MTIKPSKRFQKRELPTHHVEKMGKSLQQLREDFFAAHPDQFQGGRNIYFFAGEAVKRGIFFRHTKKWSCLITAEGPVEAWEDCIAYIENYNPDRIVHIETMTQLEWEERNINALTK